MNGFFSGSALAAEGDCGARREFFRSLFSRAPRANTDGLYSLLKTPVSYRGIAFSYSVSASNSDAPLGAGRRKLSLSANCLTPEGLASLPPVQYQTAFGIFRRPQPYCCGVTVPSQVAIADALDRTTASANEQKLFTPVWFTPTGVAMN